MIRDFPGSRRVRILSVLYSALDDSGGVDQFASCYAGIVADDSEWEQLEVRWNGILKRFDLPEYHGSKMGNLTRGWRNSKRKKLNLALVNAILLLRGTIVGVVTFNAHLEEARKRFGIRAEAQMLSLELAIENSGRAAIGMEDHRFSILLDHPATGSAGKINELLNSHATFPYYKDSFSKWSFGRRIEEPSLQVADFLASEIFRWVRDRDKSLFPHPKLGMLFEKSFHKGVLSQSSPETFEKMAELLRKGNLVTFSATLDGYDGPSAASVLSQRPEPA